MSTIKGFVVTLDQDIGEEMADRLIAAIKCIRHVADVSPSVSTVDDHMNRERVHGELAQKLMDVVYPGWRR